MRDIPLFDCSLGQEALDVLAPIFGSGHLASGDAVASLERHISERVNRREVVAMGTLTHALQLALELAGVGVGDEVITMSFNCMSSNVAIPTVGAKAIWADVDPHTAQITTESVKRSISSRTKAVVVYHVAGYPSDLDEVRELCDQFGLALIEDANNAFGATMRGRPVGSFGDFAVFSFYANRQVNSIDGAALVCRREADAHAARRLRRFGIDATIFRTGDGEIDPRYDITEVGMSSALSNVGAALGLHSLRSVDQRLASNQSNAAYLLEAFSGLSSVQSVTWPCEFSPAFWVFLLRSTRRCALQHALRAARIQTSRLHQPNHPYSCFGKQSAFLPGTARFADETLALPCGWWLTEQELGLIASTVRNFVSS